MREQENNRRLASNDAGTDTKEVSLICIGCPLGCMLQATIEGQEVCSVVGNTCKRGEIYAKKELTNPTRIVTSTVKLAGGGMVSVKTASDIPKDKIFACVQQLKDIVIEAPIQMGQVIVPDIAGTGVPIIATKEVGKRRRKWTNT